VAALLLAGREHLDRLGLPHPTAQQVIEVTGVSRSRAYELCDALLAVLPTLQRPVGRPSAPKDAHEARSDATQALSLAVMGFMQEHPGSVYGGAKRRRYSDAFRLFLLALREQHADIDLEVFATATRVPLGTLKEWLDAGACAGSAGQDASDAEDENADANAMGTTPASAQIEAVLSCWKTWHGGFGDFCEHVQHEQRIPLGRSLLASILVAHGVRKPRQRGARSPDERALRGSFETFFPGAQWVGDGSPIVVTVGKERFCFNLELMVDAKSDGFVGMSVCDAEDSAAVIRALTLAEIDPPLLSKTGPPPASAPPARGDERTLGAPPLAADGGARRFDADRRSRRRQQSPTIGALLGHLTRRRSALSLVRRVAGWLAQKHGGAAQSAVRDSTPTSARSRRRSCARSNAVCVGAASRPSSAARLTSKDIDKPNGRASNSADSAVAPRRGRRRRRPPARPGLGRRCHAPCHAPCHGPASCSKWLNCRRKSPFCGPGSGRRHGPASCAKRGESSKKNFFLWAKADRDRLMSRTGLSR